LAFHHHIFIITFLSWASTYTFAFHYLQWLPSQHVLPLPFFLSFPLIHSNFVQSIKVFHTNSYSSHLHIIPCSTFHVVTTCMEHSGAQVLLLVFITYLLDKSRASFPFHMVLVSITLLIGWNKCLSNYQKRFIIPMCYSLRVSLGFS
jgi:hypothetical protein